MAALVTCPSCARHVRSSETACPFCSVALPERASDAAPASPFTGRLTRAALVFAGAAAVAACGKTADRGELAVSAYGGPPIILPEAGPTTSPSAETHDAGAPKDSGAAPSRK